MLDPGLVARKQEETLPAVARVGYGRREALVGFTQEKAQGPSMSKKDPNKRPGRMKAKGPLGWGEDWREEDGTHIWPHGGLIVTRFDQI